jgi:hypothetical protein
MMTATASGEELKEGKSKIHPSAKGIKKKRKEVADDSH